MTNPKSDKAPEVRAIEYSFPSVEISDIAEAESWRKEVYRPIYHVHKWWAQRLGSVFRSIILSSSLQDAEDTWRLFYEPVRLSDVVVFDPFMGSGTTIGEAYKLGCKAIGRDINPVAWFAVQTALSSVDPEDVREEFDVLSQTVGNKLRDLYKGTDSQGRPCDVLYYFWVKTLPCPQCDSSVDLFSRFIFASNAYPRKHPESKAVCPFCGGIESVMNSSRHHECSSCSEHFDPSRGPARRTTAICPSCNHEFQMAATARKAGRAPDHRMYAKLVLTQDGTKEYLSITKEDQENYAAARSELGRIGNPYPVVEIPPGYNTNQVLNYGYRYWHEMFNSRQLLGLSLLARGVASIEKEAVRNALACLFSGTLEFNNMFASYKGEGTGAVRHMFSHHVLKPERTPLEANIWGTPKSSGSFSTLFKSRLMRGLDYRDNPFEVAIEETDSGKRRKKVYGVGRPIRPAIVDSYPKTGLASDQIYLSCGNSADTDLPSRSVDLVITDPPFFDNVHYSELADFFYVWQEHFFSNTSSGRPGTTRSSDEVQDTDPELFANNLQKVFAECNRVLKDDGLMAFTYHHSREEGWSSVARAIRGSGFQFVGAHPVKSELSVAVPKRQNAHPIDLDIILVCRKEGFGSAPRLAPVEALQIASVVSEEKTQRFFNAGRLLSLGDVRIIFYAEMLVALSAQRSGEEISRALEQLREECDSSISSIYTNQSKSEPQSPAAQPTEVFTPGP